MMSILGALLGLFRPILHSALGAALVDAVKWLWRKRQWLWCKRQVASVVAVILLFLIISCGLIYASEIKALLAKKTPTPGPSITPSLLPTITATFPATPPPITPTPTAIAVGVVCELLNEERALYPCYHIVGRQSPEETLYQIAERAWFLKESEQLLVDVFARYICHHDANASFLEEQFNRLSQEQKALFSYDKCNYLEVGNRIWVPLLTEELAALREELGAAD